MTLEELFVLARALDSDVFENTGKHPEDIYEGFEGMKEKIADAESIKAQKEKE